VDEEVAVGLAHRLSKKDQRRLADLLLDDSRYTNERYKCIWCAEAAYDFMTGEDTVTVTISNCIFVHVEGRDSVGGMQLPDDAIALTDVLVHAFPHDERVEALRRQAELQGSYRKRELELYGKRKP
jgi:hypothetical protein